MSELPSGWAYCQLGDIIDSIQTGKSVKCEERPPMGGEKGLVKISAVTWGEFDEQESKTLFDTASLRTEQKINPGDFLISRANTLELVGSCVIVKRISKNLYLSDKVLRLVVLDEVKPWVLACLRTSDGRKQIESLATGNQLSMRNISQEAIRAIRIPFPPLAEQDRIAEKLDELLAQVDALKARIDTIPALLKRFRQSVLAAAVSGRLTEQWRAQNVGWVDEENPAAVSGQNTERWVSQAQPNLRAQSPLVFFSSEQGAVPPSWRWEKLTNLAALESGHTPRKSVAAYWDNGDVPWISLQDIRAADGKEIFQTKHMPTNLGIENSSARLLPKGTVCFSRDISVGFVTIMGRSMATTQHFANWVCRDELLSRYLMYAFMAGRDHLLMSGQGSTVKTIYMPALKELRIALPSFDEQTEIVRRVEQLFAFADQLEAKVQSAKAHIDLLTQSILAKAFRGELVPQDPDDEPASVLLARIRAQRAAQPKAKRGRKAAATN